MSSYLVAMAVGDFKCLDGAAEGIADPHLRDAGQKRPRAHRARVGAADPHLLQRLLHDQIPVREARRRRRAGFRRRRDGEHRGDLLPRDRSARRRAVGVGRHTQEDLVDARARDGAPVVRRSGDDAVVGRPLAERGVRDLDGRTSRWRRRSRNGTSASTKRSTTRRRSSLDSLRIDAADSRRRARRRRRSTRRSTPSPTRRAPRCCAWSRATSAPRRSARASTPTSRRTPTERDVRGLLEGAGGDLGQAGRAHPPDLRQPAGRAAARRLADVRRRRDSGDAEAAAVLRRSVAERRRPLADSRLPEDAVTAVADLRAAQRRNPHDQHRRRRLRAVGRSPTPAPMATTAPPTRRRCCARWRRASAPT